MDQPYSEVRKRELRRQRVSRPARTNSEPFGLYETKTEHAETQ